MKTLKESTQVRIICVYDIDKLYGRLLIFSQKVASCLPGYTPVIEADATSFSYLRLRRLSEENTRASLLHKPGNWNENNWQPVVVIVDGSEKQWNIAWAKTGIGLPTPSA